MGGPTRTRSTNASGSAARWCRPGWTATGRPPATGCATSSAAAPPVRRPAAGRLRLFVPRQEPAGPHPAAPPRATRVQPEGGRVLPRAGSRARSPDCWTARPRPRVRSGPRLRRADADRGHHLPARRAGRERGGLRLVRRGHRQRARRASSRCGTPPNSWPTGSSCTSCSRTLEQRRREPAGDIISRLVTAGEDQVKPGEMMPVCVLLLIAGFETTVNLISNCVLALLAHLGGGGTCDAPPGAGAQGGGGDAAVRSLRSRSMIGVALELAWWSRARARSQGPAAGDAGRGCEP